jgi:transposase
MWGFIDWGTQEHELCIVDATGAVAKRHRIRQSAEGLAELVAELRALGPGLQGVGIERNDGPVVEVLLEADLPVLAINPKQIERFREVLAPSGGKDDGLDAYVGAEALRLLPDRFTRLVAPDPWRVLLRDQVRLRADLVQQQVRQGHRAREQLGRYYPRFLELGDLDTRWQRRLWQRAPTPAAARKVRPATVATLLRAHRVRRFSAAAVLETLRQPALVVSPGVVDGAVARLQYLFADLDLLDAQRTRCERVLADLLEQRREQEQRALAAGQPTDVELLFGVPGLGAVTVATLYAEAEPALSARDLASLRSRAGVAPISRLSGNQQNRFGRRTKATVWMRQACSALLRDALYHAARVAAVTCPFYRQRYQSYRQRGHTHGRACRQLGDHLLHTLMACLRHRRPFALDRLGPVPEDVPPAATETTPASRPAGRSAPPERAPAAPVALERAPSGAPPRRPGRR